MRSVRRVRRVLRKIDPWTVFKFAIVFNAIAGLVFVLGAWVMWSIALQRGIPEGIADIFESLTLTFTPDGPLYFRALVLLTIVWWVMATASMTLGSVIYNLISDMVGGVEYDVLEETFQQPRQRGRLRPQTTARPRPQSSASGAASPNSAPPQPAPPKEPIAPHSQVAAPKKTPETVASQPARSGGDGAAEPTKATEVSQSPNR